MAAHPAARPPGSPPQTPEKQMTSTHEPLGIEGTLALDDRQLITRAQLLAGPTDTLPSPAADAGIVALLAAAKALIELLLADVEEVGPCCANCTATGDLTVKLLCA